MIPSFKGLKNLNFVLNSDDGLSKHEEKMNFEVKEKNA